MLIDHIDEWLGCRETPTILDENLYPLPLLVFLGSINGGVGGYQHTRKAPKRMVGGQGLNFENVQAGASHSPRPHRFD
jgi:hypothetical protein